NAAPRSEGLQATPAQTLAYGSTRNRIAQYLERSRALRRPLPGNNGEVSFAALARSIGCDRAPLQEHRHDITATAKVVGVSEYIYLDATINVTIDRYAWLEGISLDPIRDDSLTILIQMLLAAFYIVIAFLSGIIDRDINH